MRDTHEEAKYLFEDNSQDDLTYEVIDEELPSFDLA